MKTGRRSLGRWQAMTQFLSSARMYNRQTRREAGLKDILANLEALEINTGDAETSSTGYVPRIAVAGVSGCAAGELARLLLHHPALRGTAPLFLARAGEAEVGPSTSLEALHPYLSSPNLTASS